MPSHEITPTYPMADLARVAKADRAPIEITIPATLSIDSAADQLSELIGCTAPDQKIIVTVAADRLDVRAVAAACYARAGRAGALTFTTAAPVTAPEADPVKAADEKVTADKIGSAIARIDSVFPATKAL